MITGKIPYKNINHTLKHLKIQVVDSLPYAKENVPQFNHPRELFYWLKDNTIYENDPKNVELLQTLQTLLEGSYTGTPGAGDCDCFVIATLACCAVQGRGWKNLDVVLAGRSKLAPVHIWSGITFNGQYYDMDLTQPDFDDTRHYPLTQELKFKI